MTADVVLTLHVQPGAKRSAFAGTYGNALKIKLGAPAVDGKANAELVRFLAEQFGVPQRNVVLVRGAASRDKVVRVIAPSRIPPAIDQRASAFASRA